jgi:hypothetical protein
MNSKRQSKSSLLQEQFEKKKRNMWSRGNRFRVSLHAGKIMKMFIGSHNNFNVDYKGIELLKL